MMSKSSISIPIIWGVCLCLNALSLLDISTYSGTFVSMFWFFLSILVIVFIYKSYLSPFMSALLLAFVGFCGGFFTSFLYFSISDMNAIYMGIISAIIAVSLKFGVAII